MPAPAKTSAAKFFAAVQKTRTRFNAAMVNRAALEADARIVSEKFNSLRSYREYLAAARAEKARRKGVPQGFEAAVQAQARQALRDTEAFGGALLRVAQQMHHTKVGDQVLDKAVAGAKASGPVSAKELWAHLKGSDPSMEKVRAHGLTAEMESAFNEVIGSLDAKLKLRAGKPVFEVQVPGQSRSKLIPLGRTPTRPPTTITDLLRRSEFDRVVATFTQGQIASLDIVSSDTEIEYQVADLAALAAVAGRQRVVEHVRKLEDTGLATQSGSDPVTAFLMGLFVVGVIAFLVGAELAHQCAETGDTDTCMAAVILLGLAVACFGGLGAIAIFEFGEVLTGVGFFGFAASFMPLLIDSLPDFEPNPAPS